MEFERLVGGPLDVNCYVLTDPETGDRTVIDPGFFDDRLEKIAAEGHVKLILLTHGHFDHMGGAEALREKTGAPILAMAAEFPLLGDAAQNVSLAVSGAPMTLRADRGLSDGETVALGHTALRVLATPGHTAGGCCFLTPEVIFTGDTLMGYSVGRTDLPTGDEAALTRSLQTLVQLPGDPAVCGGHGRITTLEKERRQNIYLQFLR